MIRTTSDRAAFVQAALGFKVRGMGEFGGVECSDVARIAIDSDLSFPSLPVSRHAKESVAAAALRLPHVLHIDIPRHVSEIDNGVVAWVAVDMIDVPSGPHPMHVQPRETVDAVIPAENADSEVAAAIAARNVSGIAAAADSNKPRKHSRVRVVVQKLAQLLRGKICLSHEAPQLLIGQRLPAIHSRSGASLFYQLGAT